jgi:tetratricopeptide (TPR) repeat protein
MKTIRFLRAALLLSIATLGSVHLAFAENARDMVIAQGQKSQTLLPQTAQMPMAQEQPAEDPVMTQIAYLQTEWARIKYRVPDQDVQLSAIHKLEEHAAKVTAAYPDRAEPKIWEGIILSTDAGIVKGLSALGKVKQAKALFETALKQNPGALDGSAHTSLGSLYYQVPGWPVAFGDDEQAEKHLKQALQINPEGIDPNFFYGDFLLGGDRLDEAKTYLERALRAPDRPERPLADAGRRQEIKAKLAEINKKEKNKGKPRYN